MNRQRCVTFFCVALLCMTAACTGVEPIVRLPADAAPALPVAQPADVGIDAAQLQRMLAELPGDAEHGLRSLLVMRRGQLVLEQYWNGYDRQAQQDLRSATKSITALLVGIAIERAVLSSIDEPIGKHLAAAYPGLGAAQRNLRIGDLLTMRSGLACNDRDASSPGHEDTMYRSRDWVGFFLALPPVDAPGASAVYCTGGVVALGSVLTRASGQGVPAFAEQHLFAPLGIAGARWALFDEGRQTDTGGHLALRPQDMAKIGQLVMQRGQWQGRQLVPAAWIDAATREQTRIDGRPAGGRPYGYLWWPFSALPQGRRVAGVYAGGNGGQYIIVLPALELVVVFTGGNYNSAKAQRPFELLREHILPAVR
jgi:CubicO group peptidase (beta-lactamase class C family)